MKPPISQEQFLKQTNMFDGPARRRIFDSTDYQKFCEAYQAACEAADQEQPFYEWDHAGSVPKSYRFSTSTAVWGVYVDPRTLEVAYRAYRVRISSRHVPHVFHGGHQRYYRAFAIGKRIREINRTDPDDLDLSELKKAKTNAEIRRALFNRAGPNRVLRELDAVTIDQDGEYKLVLLCFRTKPMLTKSDVREQIASVKFYWSQPRRLFAALADDGWLGPYLIMQNPSTGDWHCEGVSQNCVSVQGALAHRNGTRQPPAVLT